MGRIRKVKIKNLEQALDIFEKKAIKYCEPAEAGETASKINYPHHGVIGAVKWLYKNGELIKLNKFYESPYLSVRSQVASFLLEIDAHNAEQVLEDLIKKGDSDAEHVLMKWKAGTLDMDFIKE